VENSKINVTIGAVSFAGEGESAWLAEQLEKVLKAAPTIATGQTSSGALPGPASVSVNSTASVGGQAVGTLLSHIKVKGGETNQVKRFLATADWLRLRGETQLTTGKVSKALADHHQKRLGNPADCLNQNVAKGHCEKNGEGFYITPDGLATLGHSL